MYDICLFAFADVTCILPALRCVVAWSLVLLVEYETSEAMFLYDICLAALAEM